MNTKKLVLVSGRDSAFAKLVSMQLFNKKINVAVGRNDFDGLIKDVIEKTPAAVLILNAEDYGEIIKLICKWQFSEYKPLFVITVSSRRVYNMLVKNLPENMLVYVTVLFEPIYLEDIYDAIEYAVWE